MDGIENFLSRLLKDKIPQYHGVLSYCDFYTFTKYFTEKFTKFVHIYHAINE